MPQVPDRGRLSRAALVAVALFLGACRDSGGDGFVGSGTTVRSTAAPTTTVVIPSSGPATTAVGTTRPPATTTTRPPSTVPGRVPCSPLQLSVEATTSQPTYRLGETVRIQATLRNSSNTPCTYTSYGISTRIDDAAGRPVRPAPVLTIDALEETTLEPGQTLGTASTWDQEVCSGGPTPCTRAPAGRYRARVIWVFTGSPVEGSAFFDIVGP